MFVAPTLKFVALGLLLIPISVHARRPAPVPCNPGTFAVGIANQEGLAAIVGTAVETLTLGASGELTLGPCTAIGHLKAKRRATIVKVRFSACGAVLKAKLAVKLRAPDCSTAVGTLRAKHHKPARFTATRTSSTTTTLPGGAGCGNGIRDGGEACEGLDGCGPDARCTADCTCVASPVEPSTSQGLIAAALAAGTIDYPTSLIYRAYALFGDSRLPPTFDGQRRRGEDQALFVEASRMWGSLGPDVRTALEPFVVRPTEVQSIYHPVAPALLHARAAGGTSLADAKCPFVPGAEFPDWRATESAHFVVWSCGGGDLGQDPDVALRTIVSNVAEAAWAVMTPEAVPAKPDDFASGPAPQSRIDVYIVQGADCRDRQGACAAIEPDENGKRPLAAVIPAPPCDRSGVGALTSSAYMLLDRDSVTPNPGGPWLFRYLFAHEFFHVLADAMNLEAQGAGCFDPSGSASTIATSWLSEASAEWAAWAFYPSDGANERRNLFLAFQEFRPPPLVSLLTSDGPRPYEAFLYPFFVQQEQGGARTPFLDLWKGSTSARTPEQLDDRLDALLGFADHFRDFTVRNFNSSVELPPTERHYQSQDNAIPVDEKPNILVPTVVLAQPAKFSRPATLQPLTAQYERYQVGAAVRYVRIDPSTLANSAFVDLDALANVRGTWKRRKGKGTVLEFCRDDAADDIQDFYLVVTNRDRRRGQQVSGGYTVETRATCPAGWTGVLRYVLTIDDVGAYSDAYEAYTRDNHFRTEDTWSFVESTPAPAPDSFDTVDATWRGSLLRTDLETDVPKVCLSNTPLFTSIALSGLGMGEQQFLIIPLDEDPNQVQVSVSGNQFGEITGTGSRHNVYCLSGPLDQALPISWTEGISVLVNSLPFLVPDPGDPDHYAGKQTVSHYETPSLGDGMRIYDDYVEWDIRRRRAP